MNNDVSKEYDQHCPYGCGSFDLILEKVETEKIGDKDVTTLDFKCKGCGQIDTLMFKAKTLKNLTYAMDAHGTY